MNIEKMYNIQDELDRTILKDKAIPEEMLLVDYKYIAWKVELCEFLNEVSAFKYWKKSHEKNGQSILEELVDTIHFLLSIGIEREYDRFVKEVDNNRLYRMDFNVLSKRLLDNNMNCSSDYREAWAITLAMAFHLGFSNEDIQSAYLEKNKVNYERLESGY